MNALEAFDRAGNAAQPRQLLAGDPEVRVRIDAVIAEFCGRA
jgi:hypothetical protein